MGKLSRTVGIALLAATVYVIPVSRGGDDLGINTNMQTVETIYSIQVSREGIGADQQQAVSKAIELVKQGQLESADPLLDGVLSRFADLMGASNQTYVCFRQNQGYDQFVKELGQAKLQGGLRVTRVHDSFAQALQMKAYIASARKQWDRAIEYLNKKISYAPYEAQPFTEMGYVLNAQGKPKEALEAYGKGYALGVAHGATKTEQATALRGMGCAQIDLGKLDEAVTSFKKSLELEPGNKVALNELKYIEKIRAKKR